MIVENEAPRRKDEKKIQELKNQWRNFHNRLNDRDEV